MGPSRICGAALSEFAASSHQLTGNTLLGQLLGHYLRRILHADELPFHARSNEGSTLLLPHIAIHAVAAFPAPPAFAPLARFRGNANFFVMDGRRTVKSLGSLGS
jgi:hypothetical protein